MSTGIWIAVGVVVVLIVLLALFMWVSYTSLVTLRARVDEAWADITVQLQRRAEVLPGLTERVKGYAKDDGAVFDAVESARAESLSASTPAEATSAENHVQQALRSIFAVAEGYPRLHASPELLQLQSELGDSEDRIQASRRFYNGGVREFNAKIQVFPNSLFAKRRGFVGREFFEASDLTARAEPPRVQF